MRRRYDLSSLEFVMHAAAPCPPEVKRAMIEWWGPVIHEYYGGTETGTVTLGVSAESLAQPGTVGRRAGGAMSAHLRRGRQRGCRRGEVGEIYMRIAVLCRISPITISRDKRARDRPRRLHQRSATSAISTRGLSLYLRPQARHGDLGRRQHLSRPRSRRCWSRTPGVKDCAVFGIPDAEFGEALMAILEPQDGAAIAPDDVRAHI